LRASSSGIPLLLLQSVSDCGTSGGDGVTLYLYHAVLSKLKVINISDSLDRSVLSALLKPGTIALVQGVHLFNSGTSNTVGPGEVAKGHRTANNVTVHYAFDLWEGTSVSARGVWLRGKQDIASLVRVGSLSHDEGKLIVNCTALAIAQGFYKLKTREYANAPYRRGYIIMGEDDFDEEEDSKWFTEPDEEKSSRPLMPCPAN
jgi:hypothetical protein